jgi:hypothetical protein
MLYPTRRSLAVLLLLAFPAASPAPAAATPAPQDPGKEKEPVYRDYRGVRLGMTAAEARKALGDPADKGDAQDFYTFSDEESAQIFYGADKKVYAVSVYYTGKMDKAPTARAVLGADLEARPDGSMHRKVDYAKAGYWVAYSRTPGDSPLITVTMQASHKAP